MVKTMLSSAMAKWLGYVSFSNDQESLHILVPLHTPALPQHCHNLSQSFLRNESVEFLAHLRPAIT